MVTNYDKEYYDTQLGDVPCYPGEPTWEAHFENAADEIAKLQPMTVIEFGCSFGMLIHYLREKHGISAVGYDISEYAIRNAVSEYCYIGDVSSPPKEVFRRKWDLAICIEVLEHLKPGRAKMALANLCKLSDVVLFSSDPYDRETDSHINVHSISEWDRMFACHSMKPIPIGVTKSISSHARMYMRVRYE